MKKERTTKKGFTLIELMIVIAIIAILAAILVPNFMKARAQGQLTSCKSNVKNLGTACEMYSTENNGRYPSSLAEITTASADSAPLMKMLPKCPVSNDTNSYGYKSSTNPDKYGIWCASGDHRAGGVRDKGYPQFDSTTGLIAPGPKDSTLSVDVK